MSAWNLPRPEKRLFLDFAAAGAELGPRHLPAPPFPSSIFCKVPGDPRTARPT